MPTDYDNLPSLENLAPLPQSSAPQIPPAPDEDLVAKRAARQAKRALRKQQKANLTTEIENTSPQVDIGPTPVSQVTGNNTYNQPVEVDNPDQQGLSQQLDTETVDFNQPADTPVSQQAQITTASVDQGDQRTYAKPIHTIYKKRGNTTTLADHQVNPEILDWTQVATTPSQLMLNIKGTSGSGKTSAIHKLLSTYTHKANYFIPGRRQPIAHTFHAHSKRPIACLGHYQTGSAGCGGLDSISHYTATLELAAHFWQLGYHVELHGLLFSGDAIQTLKLHTYTKGNLVVLALNTPMEDCVAAVNARRKDKNPDATPTNPDNLLSKARSIPSVMDRLLEQSVDATWVSREECWLYIQALFQIPSTQHVWQVGEPEPTWQLLPEQQLTLQTLNNNERVLGLDFDPATGEIVFNEEKFDKESRVQSSKQRKKADEQLLENLGKSTDNDEEDPQLASTWSPMLDWDALAAQTYQHMDRPDPTQVPPTYMVFFRKWRQNRRNEKKARVAALAVGQAWPPQAGMFSADWHAEQAQIWQEQYNVLMANYEAWAQEENNPALNPKVPPLELDITEDKDKDPEDKELKCITEDAIKGTGYGYQTEYPTVGSQIFTRSDAIDFALQQAKLQVETLELALQHAKMNIAMLSRFANKQ
jgi:hypothetical protein